MTENALESIANASGDRRNLPDSGPWSPAYRLTTTGLLLVISGTAFEALAVATIMPKTVDDLGGLNYYGWAFSAFLLTNLLGLVIAGGEADRRGPRAPFLIGVLFFVAGLLIGGLAPSMIVLIIGRAVQGFGGGLISSVAYVVVGRGYPERARPKVLALYSTAWVVPGLIGPAISSLVATHVGWRWVFLGITPLSVLAALLTLPALRRIPGGDSIQRDWARIRRAVQLTVGTTILLAGLSASVWWVGITASVVGIVIAGNALPFLLPAGTLRAKVGLPAAIATMGLLNLGFFGVDAFVPLGLIDVRGTSTVFAGLALTVATVTWTAAAWIQAHYARQVSPRKLIQLGLSIIVVGVLLTIAVLLSDLSVWFGPIAWGIAGFGIGIAYSSLSLVVIESAPSGQEGQATSSMQLVNSVGAALATGIGGALIGAFSSGETASRWSLSSQFVLMIAVFAAAILAARLLPARPAQARTPEKATATPDSAPRESVFSEA